MIRLAVALFAVQAGFHGFTASLPVALARAGVADPQIGLIVGVAAAVQIPAAFIAGVVLDRVGGLRVFLFGGLAYIVGSAILIAPGVEPGGPEWPFLLARLFQGIGIAATLPAALALVPRLVPVTQRGFGLAVMGSAHNLTLVALPPLSLAILGAATLHGVALAMLLLVVAGLVLVFVKPLPFRSVVGGAGAGDGAGTEAGGRLAGPTTVAYRRLGFAFRRSWTSLILIILLYVTHWGVILAYLPQRAEAAGADIGLFFVADGVAILLARVPSGWLADRIRPIILITAGLAVTVVAIALLAFPPTTTLLVAAGLLSGGGAGLVMSPVLVELSRRSGDADRGSAFSLFSAALAGALTLGSIGAAPIVGASGFEVALLATLAGVVVAVAVAALDPGLRRSPRSAFARPA